MKKQIIKNIVSSGLSYGLILIVSIVSSRIVLVAFGSEINGLLSSVNQIFAYVALVEAGIGTATISALYRPLADKDETGVGRVIAAAQACYQSSAKWYFVCVLVVSFIWPMLLSTNISYASIWILIFLQGLSGVCTYWYTSAAINYLQACGKNYINNNVHLTATLLTHVLKIAICFAGWSYLYISAAILTVNVLKCFFYQCWIRKACPTYFAEKRIDKTLIKQRKSFLIHEISGVIFAGTDTIILSLFCGLKEVSIYAVYALIYSAMRGIIGQVFSGTAYLLGNGYSKGMDIYTKIHDRFNLIYVCFVFALYTIAYWLTIPFISLYTHGITDANYVDIRLPLLFVTIELLSSCRIADGQLIKISLHAKDTIQRSIVEAVINIVVSLIAVQYLGMYGVLIGTIVALLYRTNDIILYANKRILNRSPKKEYIVYLANLVVFSIMLCLSARVSIEVTSYIQLIGIAIPISLVIFLVYIAANFIVGRCLLRLKN